MGWWFGRKSAPADARPFVPAWLSTDSAEEGFARSYSEQFEEVYRRNPVGQRSVRLVAGMLGSLTIDGEPSTGSGAAALALVERDGPTRISLRATVDAEARAAIGEILSSLRHHGLIDL